MIDAKFQEKWRKEAKARALIAVKAAGLNPRNPLLAWWLDRMGDRGHGAAIHAEPGSSWTASEYVQNDLDNGAWAWLMALSKGEWPYREMMERGQTAGLDLSEVEAYHKSVLVGFYAGRRSVRSV